MPRDGGRTKASPARGNAVVKDRGGGAQGTPNRKGRDPVGDPHRGEGPAGDPHRTHTDRLG